MFEIENKTLNINKSSIVQDYAVIFFGAFCVAFSIDLFFSPNNMVIGGVGGIAIILQSLGEDFLGINIPISLSNTVLNLPLFIIAVRIFNIKVIIRTLFATSALSLSLFFLEILENTSVFIVLDTIFKTQGDLFLSSVFGGIITGFGLGLVFNRLATTGGTDLLATIIHTKTKHISVSNLLFALDSIIIIAGLVVFDAVTTMYSVIAVYVCSKVITNVVEGMSFAKAAWIISDKIEPISKHVMEEVDRGNTLIKGKGMYSGKEKDILLCVVSPKQVSMLKQSVKNIDPSAFVIVSDVREVMGLGFKELS